MIDADNIFLQNQTGGLRDQKIWLNHSGHRNTPTQLHHFLIELWIRLEKLELSPFIVSVTVRSIGDQHEGRKAAQGERISLGVICSNMAIHFFLSSMQTNWFSLRLNSSPLLRHVCDRVISSVTSNLYDTGPYEALSIVYMWIWIQRLTPL